MNTCNDEAALRQLRGQIFLTAERGGIAHLASSFSCLEILYVLYLKGVLRHDPARPDWPERDRLILSKGHAGLGLYAVMCAAGYLSEERLAGYLQPGCSLGGEPSIRDLPGVEASTGSLGHGLSVGVGMAMAQKMDALDARTFVILGDGECQEGSVWEAAISAAAQRLDNLTAILDANEIQKMGPTREVMDPVAWREKFEAFGWLVEEVDGHDIEALTEALNRKNGSGKPLLLLAHTVKGKGVSLMEGNPLWHFKLPNRKERKVFLAELGISGDEWKE